jgi:hypothetical protein
MTAAAAAWLAALTGTQREKAQHHGVRGFQFGLAA